MKNKNLSELSTEELLKQQNTLKLVTGFLIGALVASLALGIFTMIKNGKFTTLIVVPLALSPIVFLNLSTLKNIKKELVPRISAK